MLEKTVNIGNQTYCIFIICEAVRFVTIIYYDVRQGETHFYKVS